MVLMVEGVKVDSVAGQGYSQAIFHAWSDDDARCGFMTPTPSWHNR